MQCILNQTFTDDGPDFHALISGSQDSGAFTNSQSQAVSQTTSVDLDFDTLEQSLSIVSYGASASQEGTLCYFIESI